MLGAFIKYVGNLEPFSLDYISKTVCLLNWPIFDLLLLDADVLDGSPLIANPSFTTLAPDQVRGQGVVCYLPFVNWSHRDYDRIGRNAVTPKISHTNLGIGRVHRTMSIH